MRAGGPLTRRDLDTMRAFRAALFAVREGGRALSDAATVNTPAFVAMVRQVGRAAALSAAFDAQPRHRELPDRDTVHDWLDRHADAADVAILGERLRDGEPVDFGVRIIDDPVLPDWALRKPVLENDPRAVEWFERERVGRWPDPEPDPDDEPAGGVYRYPDAASPYRAAPSWSINWSGGVGG